MVKKLIVCCNSIAFILKATPTAHFKVAPLPAPFLVALLLLLLTSASRSDARTIAYIANADSRDIYVLGLNENDGSSKLIEKVPVGGSVMPLALSPDHKYLYASLRSEPFSVSSFAIDPGNGMLTFIETVPLADNMAYLATDRTGRYLFGASYSGNKVSVDRLTPAGRIHPTPLELIPTGKNAHCIAADLSNRFVFITNLGDDQILQYRFDGDTGLLTPNEPPAVLTHHGAGPRHLAFHPNGRFVFGTDELDGTVNTYRLESSGTLSLLATDSVVPPGLAGAPAAADLHLTPDGRFLYASERTSNTISAFRVDGATGKLSLIERYATESQPRGFNIDPAGKYLLAVGQKSNGLSTYAIDQATGALRQLSHLEVGRNPNWVEIITLPP